MPDAFKLVSTAGDQAIDVKPGQTLVVGRAVTSDVPIFDPTISRQHAQVTARDGGLHVKDLGSSNGTFLNGSRVTECVAAPNDVVTFGKVAFYVRPVAAPASAPKASEAFQVPKPAGATIVRQLPVRESGAIASPLKGLEKEAAKAAVAPEAVTGRTAKKLELLLEISKALSRQQDVD